VGGAASCQVMSPRVSSIGSSTLVEGAPGATNLHRPALVPSPLHFHTPAHYASWELDSCELGVFRSHFFLLLLLRSIFNKHPQNKQKSRVGHGYTHCSGYIHIACYTFIAIDTFILPLIIHIAIDTHIAIHSLLLLLAHLYCRGHIHCIKCTFIMPLINSLPFMHSYCYWHTHIAINTFIVSIVYS